MKKLLFFALSFFSLQFASAQCDDLIISEYVEGWSNNKAVEIYNPTANAIDLSAYRLSRYPNGSTTPFASGGEQAWVTLSGMIQAYSTHVIVIDKRDPNGTGQEAPAWDELQAKADTFTCPVYAQCNALYFNGNDALALEMLNGDRVDIFGKIGEDPGDPGSWTDVAPYISDAGTGGEWWTRDHTLVRKQSVQSGVSVNPAQFIVNQEYDSLSVNTFNNLGCHKCDCDPNVANVNCGDVVNSTRDIYTNNAVSVYPNPATSGDFRIVSTGVIATVEIQSALGETVVILDNHQLSGSMQINEKLTAGQYFLVITHTNKSVSLQKLLVQ